MSERIVIKEICEVYDGPHATPKKTVDGPVYLGIDAITDDGKINAKDATAVLKYSASKLANIKTELKPEQEKNADVNLDGNISIADAVLLNKYLVKSAELTDRAIANADCYKNGTPDANDTLTILKVIVGTYEESQLPIIPEA